MNYADDDAEPDMPTLADLQEMLREERDVETTQEELKKRLSKKKNANGKPSIFLNAIKHMHRTLGKYEKIPKATENTFSDTRKNIRGGLDILISEALGEQHSMVLLSNAFLKLEHVERNDVILLTERKVEKDEASDLLLLSTEHDEDDPPLSAVDVIAALASEIGIRCIDAIRTFGRREVLERASEIGSYSAMEFLQLATRLAVAEKLGARLPRAGDPPPETPQQIRKYEKLQQEMLHTLQRLSLRGDIDCRTVFAAYDSSTSHDPIMVDADEAHRILMRASQEKTLKAMDEVFQKFPNTQNVVCVCSNHYANAVRKGLDKKNGGRWSI
jgi:hypothetical protein